MLSGHLGRHDADADADADAYPDPDADADAFEGMNHQTICVIWSSWSASFQMGLSGSTYFHLNYYVCLGFFNTRTEDYTCINHHFI